MASRSEIARALEQVRARIAQAAARAGRRTDEIRLVAVSKTKPISDIEAALAEGQRRFGENYAQELRDKARAIDVEWHFIGPLQRNKVKYVVGTAALIHAVDSVALAEAIDARAGAMGRVQPILLEVNVAAEPQKHGIAPAELSALLSRVRALPHLECRGLMTMAPFSDEPEASRPHFRALRELARNASLPDLSMGMTGDFEVAIEEGATLVRIGSAIFGERPAIVD